MFLENNYAIQLFDTVNGGGPRAFECKVQGLRRQCGKLCKTENGMKSHLKQYHGIEVQGCLFSTDEPTQENKGNSRSLRMFTPENVAATNNKLPQNQSTSEQSSQTVVTKSGEESPKPISEAIHSKSAMSSQSSPTTVVMEKKND